MPRVPLGLWWPVWAYMAMLFGLSSLTSVPAAPAAITDAHLHMLLYAGLSIVTLRAVSRGRWRGVTRAACITAVAIAVAYGIFDEFHQAFVPNRTFEIRDIFSDAAGASVAIVALWTWGIIRARTPPDIPYVL